MRLGGFAFVAALAAVTLQPPESPQQPTFRTEASLVRVDVTVVDHHGEPVTTLTADDFRVEEDGVPQTVQSFKFVSADGRPMAGDDLSLPIRSPGHAAAEAARDDVRVFLIFWDEYHIDRFVSAINGRRALTDFVTSAFGPTDLVALMDPLLPVSALRFTRDRGELAAKILKLEGRFGIYTPTRSAVEDAHLQTREIARLRSEVTVSAMKSAAVHLGGLKEGRKAIVFVSEGLTGLGYEEATLVRDLTEAANDNNVAIYTVDPRGVVGARVDLLRTLAANTGGQVFTSINTRETFLRQVVTDASAFYLLGYSSVRNPKDGRFHSIRVRVKRSGVDVRARRGYWAPSVTEIERVRTEMAAVAAVPTDVSSALSVLSAPRPDRTMDVWIGAAAGPDRRPEMTVAWTPRSQPGQTPGLGRTVSIAARGADGERVFEESLKAGRVSFAAAPGPLQLHLTVRDASGNTLDEDVRSMTVPDFSGGDLAIGSPVVLRARNTAEARALAGTRHVLPYAGREFVRTDRVFVRFAVYGDAASRAVVSARLMSRRGTPLVDLPVTPLAGVEAGYQVDVPLASTARGDFLVAVEAVDGEQRAKALVPLRIVP